MKAFLYKVGFTALLITLFYAVKIYQKPQLLPLSPLLPQTTNSNKTNPLSIHFLNIGQGDATLIQTPENKLILVDGGPDGKVLMSKLSPFFIFGECKLEAIILTHPDSDHEAGLLEALKRCQVNQIFSNTANCTLFNCQQFNQTAAQAPRSFSVVGMTAPSNYQIGSLNIKVINPPATQNFNDDDTNADSVVLLLTYGKSTALLTGDAEIKNLQSLIINRESPVTILKVPHHGSVNNFDPTLWEEIRPQLAIVSVGKNNYGQPSPKVLGEATILGTKIMRTDEMGDVNVTLNLDGSWSIK